MRDAFITLLISIFFMALAGLLKLDNFHVSQWQLGKYCLSLFVITIVNGRVGMRCFLGAAAIVSMENHIYLPDVFTHMPIHLMVWYMYLPFVFAIFSEVLRRGISSCFNRFIYKYNQY